MRKEKDIHQYLYTHKILQGEGLSVFFILFIYLFMFVLWRDFTILLDSYFSCILK